MIAARSGSEMFAHLLPLLKRGKAEVCRTELIALREVLESHNDSFSPAAQPLCKRLARNLSDALEQRPSRRGPREGYA